jgi:hypothetical protein
MAVDKENEEYGFAPETKEDLVEATQSPVQQELGESS